MQGDSIRVTLLVTAVFERLGIPYAVGGSLSSSVHGVMRSTLDVDIVADMHMEHVQPFVSALSTEFYLDGDMIAGAIEHCSSFNLIHYDTAFKVDVFIPKPREFDRLQLQRSAPAVITIDPEQTVNVTSAEDVILSKLEWYRMGNEVSDRQWRDILGVLIMKSGELDMAYLRLWAKNLGVEDLLDRALAET